MATPTQRAKYAPAPTSQDICRCTAKTAEESWGEVTHQFPYYSADGVRQFSRFRYIITIDDHSAGPKGDKTFRYCHHYDKTNNDHRFALYGLPRIREAIRNQAPRIWLVEGEKDCEAIWEHANEYATTSHLGVNFYKEIADHFRNYQGYVDNFVDRDHKDPKHIARFEHEDESKRRDFPGSAHAIRRFRALLQAGLTKGQIRFWESNKSRRGVAAKDAFDHLEFGGDLDSLRRVLRKTLAERAPQEKGGKTQSGYMHSGDLPEGPALRRVVDALEARGHYVEKIGPTRYKTTCPHPDHDDRNPSFEFDQGEKGAVLTCESGQCSYDDKGRAAICEFLGISTAALFDDYNETGKISIKAKKEAVKEAAVDPSNYPAFHDAFEGLIGSTFDNEPNDKGNGKRMADLYGRVFRSVQAGKGRSWYTWTGTHWAVDTSKLIHRATMDLTDYMAYVELPTYATDDVPSFPEHWTVANSSGTLYQSLLGKNGALQKAPVMLAAWIAKSASNAGFFGDRLKAEQEQELFIETEKWIEKCKEGARMREAASQFEGQPGISITMDEFNTVRGTFVLQNGQINTSNCEFEPHNIEDLNTRIAPMLYDPRAKAPLWEAYLETNQPDPDTRKYLQKLAGYALSGDGNQKLIPFLYSPVGDTGKSVFTNTLEAVMGEDYAMTLADGVLSKRRFDTGGRDPDRDAIRGRRLALSMELAPNEPMDERFVKQLTGGDGVSTRGNYAEGNTRWQPECLVMVATNHLSRINAEDQAIWNRIQVVPWKVAFPKGHPGRDDELGAKLKGEGAYPGELQGIFNWMLEGLRMYRAEGLVPPAEVVEASLLYRTDADIVQKWVMHASSEGDIEVGQHTPEGEHYVSQVTPLYKIFEQWSKTEKARDIPGLQAFGKRLAEMGYEKVAKYRRDPYKGRAVILGIRIPADVEIKFNIK